MLSHQLFGNGFSMEKTLENAFMLINQLTKELVELRKEVKPIIIKHKLEKQHEERKARGVYEPRN